MSEDAERDAEFMRWMEEENRRREITHLRSMLGRLLTLQLVAGALSCGWVSAMAVGHKVYPAYVSADLASLVTVTTISGTALIFWHIRRLMRERQRRLAMLEGDDSPLNTSPPQSL